MLIDHKATRLYMADRHIATFFCISDTDSTYNYFLVVLAFSQMFNLLCERADNVHGGRLPHHVRVLWDEAANTGQVPNLEKLVAVSPAPSRKYPKTGWARPRSPCRRMAGHEVSRKVTAKTTRGWAGS